MSFEQVTKMEQIISDAVGLIDSYDGPRSREANSVFAESGKGSEIIKIPDRAMTFFGSIHTTNVESLTVKNLRADLRETISIVRPEELYFLIEGRHGECDRESVIREMKGIETVKESVQKYGESGVAMWLVAECAKRGVVIEISSPERPESEIAADLRKEFASDGIATYLMLRQWTTELSVRRTGRRNSRIDQ
jgi:hypothetical protein